MVEGFQGLKESAEVVKALVLFVYHVNNPTCGRANWQKLKIAIVGRPRLPDGQMQSTQKPVEYLVKIYPVKT